MTAFYFVLTGLIFLCVYWNIPCRHRRLLLLICNPLFMCAFGIEFFLLHLVSAVANFTLARSIQAFPTKGRAFVTIAVLFNVGLILFYKIKVQTIDSYIIPLGLSYYTFVNLGFVLDTYRKKIAPIQTFFNFYIFSGFFPTFLMGPIERAEDLWGQLAQNRTWNWTLLSSGSYLISLGLFKKFVIADRLHDLANPTNLYAHHFSGISLWIFYLLSFIQIYCDFSSYIDIVRGFAKLMHIDLKENFRQPYLAKSVPEIWSRWNITLVDWLRTNIYMPILLRTKNLYLASLLVMLAIGMWHSMAWNFAIWALYWSALYWIHITLRLRGLTLVKSNSLRIASMLIAMIFSTSLISSQSFSALQSNLLRAFIPNFSLLPLFSSDLLNTQLVTIVFVSTIFAIFLETFYYKEFQRKNLYNFILAVVIILLCLIFGVSNSWDRLG